MAAVQRTWLALEYAAEECKSDRAIVLAALQQNSHALEYAAEECKADPEIVLAAVQQCWQGLQYAADGLLLDSTFAPEAKEMFYILKISMLSGRYTVVCACDDMDAEDIVEQCCRRLAITQSGNEKLVHGTE
eukprot:5465171-Amphidinium_carterae.1